MVPLRKAIFRTLAYADIFDYPLTAEEIHSFLIGQNAKRKTQNDVREKLAKKSYHVSRIAYRDGFYFLKDRQETTLIRKKREKWSEGKLRIASRVAGRLRLIPWIKMVVVTGALAMKNSDEDDDIDFLIVTARNRLWLTRFLVVLLVELTARRRRPGDKRVKDKICLNMFLDEEHLGLPKKEQNLFTAHEVCQLRPLWEKDGIYRKFIEENRWMKKYLPNWARDMEDTSDGGRLEQSGSHDSSEVGDGGGEKRMPLISKSLDYLEILARKVQLLYMAPRKTTEITEPHRIRFHPQDCRAWVLKEYRNTCEALALSSA